jgi:microcystin-dependent protein
MGDENTLAGTTKAHKHSATSSDGGFLKTAVTGMTDLSQGSIVYGDASEIVTELAIGATEGDVLTVSSGLPAWSDPSHPAMPSGALVMWCGLYDAIPSNWLLCDGSEINRTTYADLFSAIGTQFGSAGGSTFTLPLFQNIFPRSPASSTSCGATGGADTLTLSEGQMPAHTHTAVVTDPSHVHTYSYAGGAGTGVGMSSGSDTNTTYSATTGITVANSTTGSSSSFNNRPAFLEVLFIIKT